jgi:anti-sigma factor RsiW
MDPCLDDVLKLDYLNGTLSGGDRALFEEHLAACLACRREMVELRETAAAVSALTSPAVPAAWTAAAKDRLRAKSPTPVAAAPAGPISVRRRTNVVQYALVTAGVAAGLALLFGLALGGTVRGLLPGLSATGLGISDPGVARTVDLVVGILSLHALLFVPSIIDSIYRLARRAGRRGRPASSVPA